MKPNEIFLEFIIFRLRENGIEIPSNSKELLVGLTDDEEFNGKLDALIIERLQNWEPTITVWRNQNEQIRNHGSSAKKC